ncbi:MAG: M23 family metallopeptidase [Anaerolineales bacterium]|nr:M23 family metallopeptidase [Anaerolineales bacterium]MDW8446661.1 M23 family metallopeptidase [Anaerolineales bacterium]
MNRARWLRLGIGLVVVWLVVGYVLLEWSLPALDRSRRVWIYLRNPAAYPNWRVKVGERCGDAPFLLPTSGYIGFLWGDSFRLGHRHQGIDIFAGTEPGITEVRAAYSGYLTRLATWKSSLIIRIPQDPLQPDRQIWAYYTHLASPEGFSYISEAFPPGIQEVYVEAGTLLGYQGNYSGDPGNPVGVHLHFSIVKDRNGRFLNELEFENTLDPSPYFGLPLNAETNRDQVPVCEK